MKRILLVAMPFAAIPGHKPKNPSVNPPMGIAYNAAYIRRRFEGDVLIKVIDAPTLGYDEAETQRAILDFKPDLLGISVMTVTANGSKRIFKSTKEALPNCLTVAGGPHSSAIPEDIAPFCDFVAMREGELTLGELVEADGDMDAMRKIDGVCYVEGSEFHRNKPRDYAKDLDSFPFPAWDLLPMDRYNCERFPTLYPAKIRNEPFMTMFASRGCPWNCDFCLKTAVWSNKTRFRSIDRVIDELRELTSVWKVGFVAFEDDTFTAQKKRLFELCGRIADERLPVRWSCNTRADCLDEEMAAAMARGGCAEVNVGIESGDQAVLNSINRRMELGTLRQAFKLLKKYGIMQKGLMIFGHYHETKKTMMNTLKFALEVDPSWVAFHSLVPLPGSDLYERFKEKGYLETDNWDDFNFNGRAIIHTENLTSAEIDKFQNFALRKFYLRPKKIFQFAWDSVVSGTWKRLWPRVFTFLLISTSARLKAATADAGRTATH